MEPSKVDDLALKQLVRAIFFTIKDMKEIPEVSLYAAIVSQVPWMSANSFEKLLLLYESLGLIYRKNRVIFFLGGLQN